MRSSSRPALYAERPKQFCEGCARLAWIARRNERTHERFVAEFTAVRRPGERDGDSAGLDSTLAPSVPPKAFTTAVGAASGSRWTAPIRGIHDQGSQHRFRA